MQFEQTGELNSEGRFGALAASLLTVDQKTRIARVGRDQISAPIVCRAEEVAGASADFVVLVSDDIRCAATEAARDRPDDLAVSVANVVLFEHIVLPSTIGIQSTRQNRLVSDGNLW